MRHKLTFFASSVAVLLFVLGALIIIALIYQNRSDRDAVASAEREKAAAALKLKETEARLPEAFLAPVLPGKIENREVRDPDLQRQFLPSTRSPDLASSANTCINRELEQLNAKVVDYRAGFTELNEARENANKITLVRIDWKLRCDELVLNVSGEVRHPSFGNFSISIDHQSDQGMRLRRIDIRHKPGQMTGLRLSAIEMRATEQRRGQVLSSGILNADSGSIGYDASTISDQAASDASVLYHNSDWLDLGFRRAEKRYLLSVELPIVGTARQSAN
ncbi:MAG: hypothetical protein J0L51_10745 [Rhizobiales bacterium]|nr:hypothetical protein [Hyphomicrobiales bacterium]